MAESAPNNSPTSEDTIENRYSEFLVYCVTEFNQSASLAIMVSSNKKHAKTSEFTKYLKRLDSSKNGLVSNILDENR